MNKTLLVITTVGVIMGNKLPAVEKKPHQKVFCPAVSHEGRRRTNYMGEVMRPIELVVVGKAKRIKADKKGDREELNDITIDQILYGDYKGKTVRMTYPWWIPQDKTLVISLVSTIYAKEDKAPYVMKGYSPEKDTKALKALAEARLDYTVLSSPNIFIGRELKIEGDFKHEVEVDRVLYGEKFKQGKKINVRIDGFIPCSGQKPTIHQEPLIYFIQNIGTIRRRPEKFYRMITRLPVSLESQVLAALKRRSEYPLVERKDTQGKEEAWLEVMFRGSIEEAIELLGSTNEGAVLLGMRKLIQDKKSSQDNVVAAVEKDLLLTPKPEPERFRKQFFLIEALGDMGENKPDGPIFKLIDRCIANIVAGAPQPPTPERQKRNPYNTGEEKKHDVNHSLTWLLSQLDEKDAVKYYGDRLLKLKDKLTGEWKKEVQLALDVSRVEDNLELSSAMQKMKNAEVIRSQPVKFPDKEDKKSKKEMSQSDVINMFFRPSDRACLVFSEDGKQVLTHIQEGHLHILDANTLKVLKDITLPKDYNFISARPKNGRYVLCAKVLKRDHGGCPDEYGKIKIIDTLTGKTVSDIPLEIHWRYTATKLFWLPDNKILILDDGKMYVANYLTGIIEKKTSLDIDKDNDLYNGQGFLTENGKDLFFIDGGGKSTTLDIYTRDIKNKKITTLGRIELNYGCWCNDKGIVPGGKNFFFGDPGMYIYDRKTVKPISVKEFRDVDILNNTFSSDGERYALVTGGRLFIGEGFKLFDPKTQSIVRIHNTDTGKTLFAFPSSTRWIRAIKFSPDGKSVLLIRNDNVIESRELPQK